jgi:aminopeptidase N
MKTYLSILLIFVTTIAFAQKADSNPDISKSNSGYQNLYKSTIQKYYNPKLDKYDVYFVKLDLNVSDQSTSVSGNALIEGKATAKSLDTLVLDFKNNMTVDSVIINGTKRTVTRSNDEITYIFNPAIEPGNNFSAQVYYRGTPSGEGVTSSISSQWGKRATWTLSESFHAYEWWPCKQVLSDKIDSVYLFFTCDDDCKVGSNGLLKNVVSLPNSKKRFEWKSYYPINYYLISFAVAEYQDYSIYANPVGGGAVLIQNYIYNSTSCLNYYKSEIDQTDEFIELFSEKFGVYPFAEEKYGHCLTQLGGGMEHQTMTTLGNFSYNLVSHELAHQWFGDYVTCATWQDIWINEGFASYLEYVALENLVSLASAKLWMNEAHNLTFGQPSGSVYIPFQDAANEGRIFSYSLSYKKGAAILHTLRGQINNDELFFSSLRTYLNQFKDSVATGEDFKNSIEESTGMDFDAFFNQWYYGKGYPTYSLGFSQLTDTLKMTVSQTTSSTSTPLFNLFVEYKINRSNGDTIVRLYQSENPQTYKLPIKGSITAVSIDPNNWIVNKTGTVVSDESDIINPFAFTIFPNPAKEMLTISFENQLNNTVQNISIFRSDGSIVEQHESIGNDFSLNVSDYSPGIYFIKATSGIYEYRGKFIKY